MLNTTAVCNPRQNPVQDEIQSETKFSPRKNPRKRFFVRKNLSRTLFRISSALLEMSYTNRCLSSLSCTAIILTYFTVPDTLHNHRPTAEPRGKLDLCTHPRGHLKVTFLCVLCKCACIMCCLSVVIESFPN